MQAASGWLRGVAGWSAFHSRGLRLCFPPQPPAAHRTARRTSRSNPHDGATARAGAGGSLPAGRPARGRCTARQWQERLSTGGEVPPLHGAVDRESSRTGVRGLAASTRAACLPAPTSLVARWVHAGCTTRDSAVQPPDRGSAAAAVAGQALTSTGGRARLPAQVPNMLSPSGGSLPKDQKCTNAAYTAWWALKEGVLSEVRPADWQDRSATRRGEVRRRQRPASECVSPRLHRPRRPATRCHVRPPVRPPLQYTQGLLSTAGYPGGSVFG